MDVIRIFKDFSVDFVTEGTKWSREDWVNVPCPFCQGNEGYHLGYSLDEDYWSCFRCGWKPPLKALQGVLNIPFHELKTILPAYGVNRSYVKKLPKGKKEFKFPTGVTELTKSHKRYLRNKRKFDPFELQQVWGIKSLSPVSTLDGISYSHRILIPYRWNGVDVSFDARDVTDKQTYKYQACMKEREAIEHKKILYGNREAWGKLGIIVEGTTDAWRLGELAAATSGIKYTAAQVKIIGTSFKQAAVVFDGEIQAQKAARQLVADLRLRGVNAINIKLKGGNDAGSLKPHEAKELIQHIKRKI